MNERLLYPLAEVAEMTGFTLSSLVADCRAGRIKHVHRGRERTMTRAQIDLLIEQSTVKPTRARIAVVDEDEMDRARAARRTGRAA